MAGIQSSSFQAFSLLASSAGLEPAGTVLGAAIGSDLLMMACVALALVALAALSGVVAARRETRRAARQIRQRAQSMQELLSTVRMAESIAGIGVWQYDPNSGVQAWSHGLKRLFGVEQDETFVEGDAETLLFANNIDLIAKVRAKAEEVEPYTLSFDIFGFDGVERTLSVHACNLMGADRKVHRVVAVVKDITEQRAREIALESSRIHAINEAQQAKQLAETDALTGLANRRRVMAELDRMVLDARVTQMPLVLVMFDIDHFKRVNDTHGHPAGDKVLKRVAELALAQARNNDVIGRVGGEEFVWIIPGAANKMGRVMTERLRQAIASQSAVDDMPPVTVSLGYTTLQHGDTALSFFSRADDALYDAKGAGRNRVRVAA